MNEAAHGRDSASAQGGALRIVLLEDDARDAELIEAHLVEAGLDYTLERARDRAGFSAALASAPVDLILSDYNIPGFGGAEALIQAQSACAEVPFIFVSGALGEEKAIELLKRGATDYVLKDKLERLVPSLGRALREARDKAERRRAEAALQESERALNTLMGNMPGMAFRCVPREPWVFEYASRGAVELSGYQPEDFCAGGDTTWAALMHKDDMERVGKEAEAAFAERRQLTVTYRIRTRSGEEKWVWDRSVGIYGQDGALERIEGFVTDITESKKRADFEQQLLGIVSHDLRNPLQAILLAATTALHQRELDERTMKALVRIQSSVERAARMIRDLLDFTQARLGEGIHIDRQPVSLHELVQQVVDEAALTHPHRELRVSHHGEGHGEWDPDRLSQVISNLVLNALRYSTAGTPISVTTTGDAGTACLEVHNQGEPISEELRARLFQPMQRGATTGNKERSVGLGLYIVDHVVRRHGGVVDVHSTAADGTTFRVSLPRRVASAPA